nr:hypothetical protein CFP56_34938 [Quercus suber]
MQFNSKIIALFSVLSCTALASDVFSAFNDASGAEIGSTQFDVGNTGCFSVSEAEQVSFTQSGGTHTADGPYCLTGFSQGGCAGTTATQQFQNVELNDGKNYALNTGLAAVGSYMWVPSAC